MVIQQYQEIPYNYASLADKEIVVRFLRANAWELLNQLRKKSQHWATLAKSVI